MKLPRFLRVLLWPAGAVFGLAVLLRAWLYRTGILRQKRLDGIVISVGNLTAGGTGKTPMVIWLAQRLAAAEKSVGILTRGYRSILLPATEDGGSPKPAQRVSDEVVVLQSHLGEKARIGVGANRYEQGRQLAQQSVDWFILDDGLQHLRLARDVEIVMIDATNPFDGGWLLPAGRLREPRSALSRADLVVITRREPAAAVEAIVRRHTAAPIFYAQTELTGVFRIHPEPAAPASETERGRRLFAFCGTGNPDAFFDDLRRWGMKVAGEASFPDHHLYTQRDIESLERHAGEMNARGLVCTEKDLLNFRGASFEAYPVYVCRIALRPSRPDEFWQAVVATLVRRRPGALA